MESPSPSFPSPGWRRPAVRSGHRLPGHRVVLRRCVVMTAFRRWQDYGTVVLGVLAFVGPFFFGDTSQTTAAWTAYVGGVLLVLSGPPAGAATSAAATAAVPDVLAVLAFLSPSATGLTA